MIGYRFAEYVPKEDNRSTFEKMLEVFMELLTHTSGDVKEALDWLQQLDEEYKLTSEDYTMDDFIEDLKKKGYVDGEGNLRNPGGFKMTAKSEQLIRKRSLEQIFGKLKKGGQGNHRTPFSGSGEEATSDRRKFEFGDSLDKIAMTDSLRNAQIQHGINNFMLTENDLEVQENEYKTQNSTVLMIDISHSMILYGEDRITPAKKVAMALSELITTKYPKDTLDILVFGNDAWQIQIKDLPYLQVGPYHTNTVAGLELAMDLLRRRKTPNKQIFMITDGKPTCIKENGQYIKVSWGLDPKILNKTLNLAARCRKLKIPITTFMIASDPYLQKFVREFTQVNQGKAYYSGLDKLGEF
ncbi:MAG: vWA domain-containing protein, partial [Chitinophagales bacterium]